MKTSEAINDLVTALAKAQGEMKNPEKNKTAKIPTKTGKERQYHYADLPSTFDAVRSVLAKHGLSHFSTTGVTTVGGANFYVLWMRIAHASGQWIEAEYPLPFGEGVDDKSIAASITYGRRYLFTALTGLAADEDLDGEPENEKSSYEPRVRPAPAPVPVVKPKVVAPSSSSGRLSRDDLNRTIMKLYSPFMKLYPEAKMVDILQKRYHADETRLLTVEQLADLAGYLEDSIQNHEPGSQE